MNEYSKISSLKGIGEKTEKLFQKLHIETVGDLVHYYPRGYEIYDEPISISDAQEGEVVTITGSIYGKVQTATMKNLQVTTIYVKDLTGTMKAVWFRMPFLKNTLGKGGVITLRGRVVNRKGSLVMEQPEIFYPSASYDTKADTMQPVYALTTGLTNNMVVKAMKQVVDNLDLRREYLPKSIRIENHLAEYNYAIKQIHFPDTMENLIEARRCLVFHE